MSALADQGEERAFQDRVSTGVAQQVGDDDDSRNDRGPLRSARRFARKAGDRRRSRTEWSMATARRRRSVPICARSRIVRAAVVVGIPSMVQQSIRGIDVAVRTTTPAGRRAWFARLLRGTSPRSVLAGIPRTSSRATGLVHSAAAGDDHLDRSSRDEPEQCGSRWWLARVTARHPGASAPTCRGCHRSPRLPEPRAAADHAVRLCDATSGQTRVRPAPLPSRVRTGTRPEW